MAASKRGFGFWKCIRAIRLIVGLALMPVLLMRWQHVVVYAVMARLGMHPDGPAIIGLGVILIWTGLVVPLAGVSWLALPYVLHTLEEDRLGLRAVLVLTLTLAAAYALAVYAVVGSYGYPWFREAVALLSVPGMILWGLCFYVIGVWRLPRKKPESPSNVATGA